MATRYSLFLTSLGIPTFTVINILCRCTTAEATPLSRRSAARGRAFPSLIPPGQAMTLGRKSSAGGNQEDGLATAWAPLRISFTESLPCSPEAGNHTNGMLRRWANMICLPNLAATGETSHAIQIGRGSGREGV